MKLFKLVLLMSLIAGPAFATPADREDDLGVGAMAGTVTGVTATKWMDTHRAFDIAYGANPDAESQVHADHLWTFEAGLPWRIMPYGGVGLGAGFNRELDNQERDIDAFARVPVGLSWYADRVPVGVFAEIAPSFIVTPVATGYMDANLGARYHF
ncbi:MAG TPA: hypothetical protein VFV50_04030 [Bdellovibrionales bacterium]|nr:hypothetical protein [Bdellovibrionales bacterium]